MNAVWVDHQALDDEVTGMVIGSSEGQSEARGTIDVDSIEIAYKP